MAQWADDDRAVLDLLAELRQQQRFLSYADGQWFELSLVDSTASPIAADEAGILDRAVELVQAGTAPDAALSQAATPTGVEPEPDADTADSDAEREAFGQAADTVAKRSGYAWTGTRFTAGRRAVSPTGKLRTRSSQFITRREQEALHRETRSVMAGDAAPASATRAGQDYTPTERGGPHEREPQEPQEPQEPEPPDEPQGEATEEAADEAADADETISSVEASDILQVSPGTVANYARRGRLPAVRERGRWRFRRGDVQAFATERDAEEVADEDGGGRQSSGGGRPNAGPNAGDIFGAGRELVGAAAGGAVDITGAVAGFTQRTIATALTAAGGASGAGVAQIGGAVVNMVTGGIRAAATGAATIGGAVVNMLAAGIQLVAPVAAFAVGGAVLGLFVGAIATIGSGIASALSEVVGVAAKSAQEALQGVVTVLQDLTRTGRQASDVGFGMRATGGVEPGQDIQTMLFGRSLGADTAGMMSQWTNRPEIMPARMGAVGVQYNEQDIPGSMIEAAQAIRGLPGLLQRPMAGVVSGGHPDTMLRLAHMPDAQLRAAQDLATEMGANKDLLQKIFGRLEPTLNRLSTLFLGIKLDVLNEAIPLIEVATTGMFALWEQNKNRVFGVIERLPEIAGAVVNAVVRGAAAILPALISIYQTLRGLWDWARVTLGPVFRGTAAALGIDLPAPRGAAAGTGPGGYAPGSPQADSFDAARRRTEIGTRTIGWVSQHPIETVAAMSAANLAWRYGVPAAGRAIGARLGIGGAQAAAGAATETAAAAETAATATGWGARALAWGQRALPWAARAIPYAAAALPYAAGAATAVGGWELGGRVLNPLLARTGVLGPAMREAQSERDRGSALRREVGEHQRELGEMSSADRKRRLFGTGETQDPILRSMQSAQSYLDELAKRDFMREFRDAVVDGQREANQQREPVRIEMKSIIEPSPEFSVQMEMRNVEQMFRALQVTVA